MDEVYKNCCWFCLAESSKTKPTKIEKNGCPALIGKVLRIDQIWPNKIRTKRKRFFSKTEASAFQDYYFYFIHYS
jgi:hypothetical protein